QHMNPGGLSAKLQPTAKSRIEEFVRKLRENNITVMVRNTQGDDIAAACGQLAYSQSLLKKKKSLSSNHIPEQQ
ncbi:MAG TPA: hypothetical protein VI362_06700, partial [Ignavibacteriaceae bacterium]|nr:hypothetical protein [Ignavibacteriaceae bacterium]